MLWTAKTSCGSIIQWKHDDSAYGNANNSWRKKVKILSEPQAARSTALGIMTAMKQELISSSNHVRLTQKDHSWVMCSGRGICENLTGERGRRYYKIHRIERSYGQFVRSFILSDPVDDTKEKAEFKDGLLHRHLPESEKVQPETIEVKSASQRSSLSRT